MAAACTAMEVQDRRLSISKSSASKISKPSPSPALKGLSASVTISASPPSSSSSTAPTQLPSSITSSPSRPIAKVVNADPSSFRRVVQELTGTASPSISGTSPRTPSRLQRIAPPPLRATMRNSVAEHHPSAQNQILREQMYHHQDSHSMFLLQQHAPKVGNLSSSLSFTDIRAPSCNVMSTQVENPNPNSGSEPAFELSNSNPNPFQSLPMLSPHLLSPLPALTPGDNTWANPIEAIYDSPKVLTASSSDLPALLPLPNSGAATSSHGHGNALLPRPVHWSQGQSDGLLPRTGPVMTNSLISGNGQPLPPLLATPSYTGVLPPWSPSPLPFSPGLLSPSPGPGPPSMAVPSLVSNGLLNPQMKYGSANSNMPNNFSF